MKRILFCSCRVSLILLGFLIISSINSCAPKLQLVSNDSQVEIPKLADGLYVKFNTTKGDIICQLYYEKVPMTVGNFVGLAEGKLTVDTTKVTKPFFNGLKFHRVIADFMIQGGDPQGNGMGVHPFHFPGDLHLES